MANAKNQVAAAEKAAQDDVGKAALAKAQQGEQTAQTQATAAEKMLTRATAKKKVAEAGLVSVKKQVATATTALAAAEKAAADMAIRTAEAAKESGVSPSGREAESGSGWRRPPWPRTQKAEQAPRPRLPRLQSEAAIKRRQGRRPTMPWRSR